VAAWAKVRTARATFEQTITNSLTGRTLTATGEYQQQKPGKLSVRFSQPANERIVADGSRLWLYLPSTTPGQVIRTSLKDGGSGTVDLTAQFLTSPRTRYTITEKGAAEISGRATHAYDLVPGRNRVRSSRPRRSGSTTRTRRSGSSRSPSVPVSSGASGSRRSARTPRSMRPPSPSTFLREFASSIADDSIARM
jgi:outer membrane lipoprotein-sorting protein